MNCLITSGLLKRNDIKDLNKLQEFTKLLKSYDVVLVDEVEYTINPSGEFLYERLSGASYFYGFSGTADKSNGNMISFINGLSDIVITHISVSGEKGFLTATFQSEPSGFEPRACTLPPKLTIADFTPFSLKIFIIICFKV